MITTATYLGDRRLRGDIRAAHLVVNRRRRRGDHLVVDRRRNRGGHHLVVDRQRRNRGDHHLVVDRRRNRGHHHLVIDRHRRKRGDHLDGVIVGRRWHRRLIGSGLAGRSGHILAEHRHARHVDGVAPARVRIARVRPHVVAGTVVDRAAMIRGAHLQLDDAHLSHAVVGTRDVETHGELQRRHDRIARGYDDVGAGVVVFSGCADVARRGGGGAGGGGAGGRQRLDGASIPEDGHRRRVGGGRDAGGVEILGIVVTGVDEHLDFIDVCDAREKDTREDTRGER